MKSPRLISNGPAFGDAFTLVELLFVIGLLVVITALAAPALKGLTGAGDLTSAAYSIQGALEQARTYAVANHTYTWVGFFEEDNSEPSQTPARAGIGRVVLCVVASRDGSCIYNKPQAQMDNPPVQSLPSARLVQIGKLIRISGVHIFAAASQSIGKRPAGIVQNQNLVGLTSQALLFSFQYPLTGPAAYTFGVRPIASPNGIIQFSPRGEAISDAGPVTLPATTFELAIMAAHGGQVGKSTNIAAIDINGLTGQTTIYRP